MIGNTQPPALKWLSKVVPRAYNFRRKHQTVKTTPPVMAGVADEAWTMLDFAA